MRKLTCVTAALALCGLLGGGCAAAEKVAESLAGKNVAGSGFLSIQKIGVDPETRIPEMKSTVISGDFQTIKAGSNYFNYREEESGAWYNAENRTRRQSLTITAGDNADLAELLQYALKTLQQPALE